ncbi:MAG: hypothetical protein EBU52_03635 [Cytophagia bacterium]|nr:hypothetical protein [Cytophagia bacterium]
MGMKKILLLFIFSVITMFVNGQNIASANLTWDVDEVTDLQTQTTIPYKATFKTNASSSVEWIQKEGALATLYNVVATEGTWENISSYGSFTFLLNRNGKHCRLTVEKDVGGTFITLHFETVENKNYRQRFRVLAKL